MEKKEFDFLIVIGQENGLIYIVYDQIEVNILLEGLIFEGIFLMVCCIFEVLMSDFLGCLCVEQGLWFYLIGGLFWIFVGNCISGWFFVVI